MTRFVLTAFITLTACGTHLTSTVVQVEGHAVEVVEARDGGTTVVFEAGLGNDWTAWDAIASEVASSTKVFAYSRPGYGRSEASSEPRDPAHLVQELRTLLAARGLTPPYVLVGHSFGGTYMELFAKLHPEEIAGLVLVDFRHPDFTAQCEAAGIKGCVIPPSMWASLSKPQPAELAGFESAPEELRAAGPFGHYPVRVLISTSHGLSPAGEALWVKLAGSIADEAEDGQQQIFEGASHNLEVERPREVAKTILSLIPAPAN
jgi:pimeloyl-ACP methyl ester carboxylesterase